MKISAFPFPYPHQRTFSASPMYQLFQNPKSQIQNGITGIED